MGNTCCCSPCQDCFGKRDRSDLYEPILQANESEAISELLHFLDNREGINFFEGEPLKALKTLASSENVDLQRSAALAFAEITEKDVRQVGRDTLDPILSLLQSHDPEVQRASSAALGNLAVNMENKLLIVKMGGLDHLIRQMGSPNVEVQCNAVGCITNLATHDENKAKIAKSDALRLLVNLARSKDARVQRNATGALLNMTHTQENRQQLVSTGAIPVLISLLRSPDADVQYYCTTALSNIAVDANNRKKLAQTDSRLVQDLIELLQAKSLKVQCQAALALRNLASDEKYQLDIVRYKGLPHLLRLLKSSFPPLILSSVACIRNISIHPDNETPIIDEGFVNPLIDLLSYDDHEEIQLHATTTLRNLATSSDRNKLAIFESGAMERLRALVSKVPLGVQIEMTAAIAMLTLGEELKPRILAMGVLDVLVPLTASSNVEVQGNSAAAIGNLSSKVKDYSYFIKLWNTPHDGLHRFLVDFLDASQDTSFQHIGVWIVEQFLEGGDPEMVSKITSSPAIIQSVTRIATAGKGSRRKGKPSDANAQGSMDDVDGDIYSVARRVVAAIQEAKS